MTVIVCVDPPGCRCTPECEWPCAHRAGLTDAACCPGCPPLPDDAPTDLYDQFPAPLAQDLRRRNQERLAELDATTTERQGRMAQIVRHTPTPEEDEAA